MTPKTPNPDSNESQGGVLLALAARCEAASGPDIQLDADIRDALDLPHDYSVEWRGWGFNEAGEPIEKPKAFPYTASLDAAMTLAMSNWWFEASAPLSPEAYGYSREDQRMPRAGFQMIGPPYSSGARAATIPLAICAASLRARSLSGEGGRA